MKPITRLLAVAGLGLGAAFVVGAGPAQAATTTTAHHASMQTRTDWNDGNDDAVGYFRTRFGCERVGQLGEDHGRWDDYDCSRVRFGFNRGAWALEVSTDDWNGNWDDDNWYCGWYNSWHGGDFDGGWDHGGWNHGGWHDDHHTGPGNVVLFPLSPGSPVA